MLPPPLLVILVFVVWDDNWQSRCGQQRGWQLWQQPNWWCNPVAVVPPTTWAHRCQSSPSSLGVCSHAAAVIVWQKNCWVKYNYQHALSAVLSIVPLQLQILLLCLILLSLLNKKNRRMQSRDRQSATARSRMGDKTTVHHPALTSVLPAELSNSVASGQQGFHDIKIKYPGWNVQIILISKIWFFSQTLMC